jgi:hypothetical protein
VALIQPELVRHRESVGENGHVCSDDELGPVQRAVCGVVSADDLEETVMPAGHITFQMIGGEEAAARLSELRALYSDVPGLGDRDIHHLADDLRVRCGGTLPRPAACWLHGATWDTPGTPREICRPRRRHLAGSSRGVGIRLVRDGTRRPASAAELARRLACGKQPR